MFAGIVETMGSVQTARSASGSPLRLAIDLAGVADGLAAGASVAVNGVCLTLANRPADAGGLGEFDVIAETLRRTNLGALRPGSRVNLERSLRAGDRIDGHFVQGHIDAAGVVDAVDRGGGEHRLWIRIGPEAAPYVVSKGSIAVDGVSLTIADVAPGRFCVALIPTTLQRTTLGERQRGDRVNIETDILARLVISRLAAYQAGGKAAAGGLTMQRLREVGLVT